ncbi:MAG TPA: hypothetical protein DCS55_00360 [Acidimicrobiaceae bacterium]|nr:hypothetical protein [Acidimicrobiaceae bacterium]
MADHRSHLRNELVRAARHRQEPATSDRFALRRFAPILAVAALLVVAAVGSLLRSDPVGAEVFRIETLSDGTVVIDVISAIKDPERAAAELDAAGFAVSLEAVPTPESLVGRIVAAAAEPAPGNQDPNLSTEIDDQRVVQLRAEPGTLGTVTIFYGRPAGAGELYVANDTVPGCAELAGRQVTDEIRQRIIDDYGPRIRWKDLGPPLREITAEQIDDEAVVVQIIGLSSEAALVTVGETAEVQDSMTC